MSRAISFVVVSVIAAICNFGSRVVFSLFAPYTIAVVLAFAVGLTTAFWLNRRFVFRSDGSVPRQFGLFFAVNLVALLQTVLISLLMLHWVLPLAGWNWHSAEIAHAAGIAAPMVTSYFGHKHVTFRAS
jgi:putative flippase GtrA